MGADSTAAGPGWSDTHPVVAGYRIGEEMGHGPLGKIYRAQSVETGELVVFRGFTRPEGADEARWEAAKAQFRDLLTLHQSLPPHPAVQKIVGFGEENGLFWVASEYFEARTLHNVLAEEGAQSLAWSVGLLKQVGEAVDWAGGHGLCHTDLTSFNVLLVRSKDLLPEQIRVKVINFGLAHARRKYGSRYAAPEQMSGAEGDRRSDVYAVGALLYELLTGTPIFTGGSLNEVAEKVQSASPVPLDGRPAYVQNVLAAMLAKDPAQRYGSVLRAMEDLAAKRNPSLDSAAAAVVPGTPPTTLTAIAPHLGVEGRHADEASIRKELDLGSKPELPRGTAYVPLHPETRVSLQEYRLDEQDLVEIRRRGLSTLR